MIINFIINFKDGKINEERTRRKISFPSLKPQLLPKFLIFLFLVHFKRPKMLREHQLKLYKSF